MTDFIIKGAAELEKLLGELPAKIEQNIMRGALRAGAKVIQQEAKRLCPVGKTDDLVNSIRVDVRARHGHITATIKAGNAKAYYAGWVEKGTARHWIRPKGAKSLFVAGLFKEAVDHPGAEKKPFMRPALYAKSEEAIQAVANYIEKRLAKEAAK